MPDWLNAVLDWVGVISSILGIIGFCLSIFSNKKSDMLKIDVENIKSEIFSKIELNKSGDGISNDLEKISKGVYSDVDTVQHLNSEIMMINSLGIELTNNDKKIFVEATELVKKCIQNNSYLPNDMQQIKSYAETLRFIIRKVRYK